MERKNILKKLNKYFYLTISLIFLLTIYFSFNQKIYAEENIYTISFKDENKEFIKTYNIKKGQLIQVPSIGEKIGYNFLGFFDEENQDEIILENYNYDKNKIFIPKFSPKNYSVTITLPNNSEKTYSFVYNQDYDFNLVDTLRGYNSIIKIDEKIIEPKGIWKYDTNRVVVEYNPITYNITYEYNIAQEEGLIPENPETYTILDSITLKRPLRKGYRFLGYKNQNIPESNYYLDYKINPGSYGNLQIKAIYEKARYNLNFLDISDIEKENNPKYYLYDTGTVKINNPNKEGYIFEGWTINEEFIEGPSLYLDTKKYYFDLNLKPRFSLIEYNINLFLVENARFETPNKATYNIETNTFTISKPILEDKEFIGWSSSISDKTNLVLEKVIQKGSLGEINLFAHYENKKYNLIYKDNEKVLKTEKYEYNQKIKNYIPEKLGYNFISFYTDNTLTKTLPNIYQYHTDKEVYAKFELIIYRLNYDLQGGSLREAKKTYTIVDNQTIRKPIKPGYEFIGWNVNDNKDIIKDFVLENNTGDIILKANWKPIDASKEQEEKLKNEKGSQFGKKKPNIFIFVLVAILVVLFGFILVFLYTKYKKNKKHKNLK